MIRRRVGRQMTIHPGHEDDSSSLASSAISGRARLARLTALDPRESDDDDTYPTEIYRIDGGKLIENFPRLEIDWVVSSNAGIVSDAPRLDQDTVHVVFDELFRHTHKDGNGEDDDGKQEAASLLELTDICDPSSLGLADTSLGIADTTHKQINSTLADGGQARDINDVSNVPSISLIGCESQSSITYHSPERFTEPVATVPRKCTRYIANRMQPRHSTALFTSESSREVDLSHFIPDGVSDIQQDTSEMRFIQESCVATAHSTCQASMMDSTCPATMMDSTCQASTMDSTCQASTMDSTCQASIMDSTCQLPIEHGRHLTSNVDCAGAPHIGCSSPAVMHNKSSAPSGDTVNENTNVNQVYTPNVGAPTCHRPTPTQSTTDNLSPVQCLPLSVQDASTTSQASSPSSTTYSDYVCANNDQSMILERVEGVRDEKSASCTNVSPGHDVSLRHDDTSYRSFTSAQLDDMLNASSCESDDWVASSFIPYVSSCQSSSAASLAQTTGRRRRTKSANLNATTPPPISAPTNHSVEILDISPKDGGNWPDLPSFIQGAANMRAQHLGEAPSGVYTFLNCSTVLGDKQPHTSSPIPMVAAQRTKRFSFKQAMRSKSMFLAEPVRTATTNRRCTDDCTGATAATRGDSSLDERSKTACCLVSDGYARKMPYVTNISWKARLNVDYVLAMPGDESDCIEMF